MESDATYLGCPEVPSSCCRDAHPPAIGRPASPTSVALTFACRHSSHRSSHPSSHRSSHRSSRRSSAGELGRGHLGDGCCHLVDHPHHLLDVSDMILLGLVEHSHRCVQRSPSYNSRQRSLGWGTDLHVGQARHQSLHHLRSVHPARCILRDLAPRSCHRSHPHPAGRRRSPPGLAHRHSRHHSLVLGRRHLGKTCWQKENVWDGRRLEVKPRFSGLLGGDDSGRVVGKDSEIRRSDQCLYPSHRKCRHAFGKNWQCDLRESSAEWAPQGVVSLQDTDQCPKHTNSGPRVTSR